MNNRIAWIAALALAAFGSVSEAQTITAVYTTYSSTGVPTKLDITGTAFCTSTSTTSCGTKPPLVRLGGNTVAISGSSPTGIGVPLTGVFADGDYMLSVTPSGKSAITYAFTLKSKTGGGATGPQGPAGPAGPAGPQGATGLQGPKGDTGAAGADGTPGLQGPVGATGPQGPMGLQGLKGDTGDKGDKGDAGAQGPNGAPGVASAGTMFGAILFWNGVEWKEIQPPSSPGIALIFCEAGPVWGPTCPDSRYFNENFSSGRLNTLLFEDVDGAFNVSDGRIRLNATGAVNTSDRHYIRTIRADYNSINWIFRFKIHTPETLPVWDILFGGFGEAYKDSTFANEAANSATIRFHVFDRPEWRVDFSVHTLGSFNYTFAEVVGALPNPLGKQTFSVMLCKDGDALKMSVVDERGNSLSTIIPSLASSMPWMSDTNSRLYFGNSSGDFEYSDFSVSPLAGECP